eukprot:357584-Chlamydomonas_euryale.AAC.2
MVDTSVQQKDRRSASAAIKVFLQVGGGAAVLLQVSVGVRGCSRVVGFQTVLASAFAAANPLLRAWRRSEDVP